jgi:hypothetical protein
MSGNHDTVNEFRHDFWRHFPSLFNDFIKRNRHNGNLTAPLHESNFSFSALKPETRAPQTRRGGGNRGRPEHWPARAHRQRCVLGHPCGTVRDLHMLNGKLFPFLPTNDGSVEDYIDLQRMMFMLNQNYRSKSFSVFGEGAVADSFRKVVANFTESEKEHAPINGRRIEAITRIASEITPSQTRNSLPIDTFLPAGIRK